MRRILTLLLLAAAASAAEPPGLAEARAEVAAERARQRLLDDWARERDDLERLLASREAALTQREDALAAKRTRCDARRAADATHTTGRAALDAESAAARTAAEAVVAACAAADPATAPLPPPSAGPIAAVDAAVSALAATRTAAARWDVQVAVGTLDRATTPAAPVPAQVLTGGLACAWWLALDGRAAGTARRVDSGWLFTPIDDPRAATAIADAIAQARGAAVPDPVLLPAAEAP